MVYAIFFFFWVWSRCFSKMLTLTGTMASENMAARAGAIGRDKRNRNHMEITIGKLEIEIESYTQTFFRTLVIICARPMMFPTITALRWSSTSSEP
jgi:hypothetical protein